MSTSGVRRLRGPDRGSYVLARRLLLLLWLVGCATTGKTGYYIQRSEEHVYRGSRSALLERVARLMVSRGLQPVLVADDRLETPWSLVGGHAEYSDEPIRYQSFRVTISSVDDRHHTLRIERGTVTGLGTPERTMGDRNEQIWDAHNDSTPLAIRSAVALAPPTGSTEPRYARQGDLEWALLQQVDPRGADSIRSEETVSSGCAHVRAPRPPPPELLQVIRTFPEVPGADELLAARHLVLLGEVHGTEQAPDFVAAVACRAAELGVAVVIGLELPVQENTQLQAFVASAGRPEDRDAYLSSSTWRRDWFDGRSSQAMFALLERLRVLRHAGAELEVRGIDNPGYTGDLREAAMADVVEEIRRENLARATIVLVGNVHAQTTPGKISSDYRPLGERLDRFGLRPVSLVMAFDAGTAWNCTLEKGLGCGVHPVRSWPPPPAQVISSNPVDRMTTEGGMGAAGTAIPDTPKAPRYIRRWSARTEGFDGLFYVGAVTASPPAREFLATPGVDPAPVKLND